MSDQPQVQEQQQGQSQPQMSLSDFLLAQRRMIDQIITNYENNMAQFAQANEELSKKIQELQGGTPPPAAPETGSDG